MTKSKGETIDGHVYRRDPKTFNPVWRIPALVPVERMDNTLAMTMPIGTVTGMRGKDKIKGDVCYAVGGFVFIVSVEDKEGSRRYAINMHDFINDLLNVHDVEFKSAPKMRKASFSRLERRGKSEIIERRSK